MNRFIKLLLALLRHTRCPHTYHPWKGPCAQCERTRYHWGQHRGELGKTGAQMYWHNTNVTRDAP